jgi:uncharacterized membrane protein
VLDADTREDPWTFRAAALAGPIAFLPLLHLHLDRWGDDFVAVLPLGLGAIAAAGLFALRWRGPAGADRRRSAVAWLGAVALGFVTVAIPLQLRNEWVTVGWSLQAVATLLLWRRVDHAGLKMLALALAAAATLRLVGNPWVLEYHPRGAMRILNWLSYGYLVPAACLVASAWLLHDLELPRRRVRWEPPGPWATHLLGGCAIAIVFVWINLTIYDWFSVERMLDVTFDRLPARDLTLSIAWALYGLGLLGLGVAAKSRALRGLALGMVMITGVKVFLYDLGHLHDLYRVMSLVGLALTLIAISLAYKRFVFKTEPEPQPTPKPEGTDDAAAAE